MSDKCYVGPQFDALVAQFKSKVKANFILDKFNKDNEGETLYPTMEEARTILENAFFKEKDEMFVESAEEYKKQRLTEQHAMLDTLYWKSTYPSQRDVILALQKMSEKGINLYKESLRRVQNGESKITTVSNTGYQGANIFKLDPLIWVDFKEYGIFMHEILEIVKKEQLLTNKEINEILTEEFFEEQLTEFRKKKPFEINNLDVAEMYSYIFNILNSLDHYSKKGYILIPEITLIGETKTKKPIISRTDILAISPTGQIVLIDFKTKKTEKLFNEERGEITMNSALAYLAAEGKPISFPEGSLIGDSFRALKQRSTFDTWMMQLDIQENTLIQNGIVKPNEVEKVIAALFYQVSADKEHMKSVIHVFDEQDYYQQAVEIFGDNDKRASELNLKMGRIKKFKRAVNIEIPISKEDERIKEESIPSNRLMPDDIQADKFMKLVESSINTKLQEIYRLLKEEKTKENDKLVKVLEEKKTMLNQFKSIVKAYNETQDRETKRDIVNTVAFKNTVEVLHTQYKKLDESIKDVLKSIGNDYSLAKINKAIKVVSEISDTRKGLVGILNGVQDIITQINDANVEKGEPQLDAKNDVVNMFNEINLYEATIVATQNKLHLMSSNVLLATGMGGKKVFDKLKERTDPYILTKKNQLEERLKELTEGTSPASLLFKTRHHIISFFSKQYRDRIIEELGPDSAPIAIEIQKIQKELDQLNNSLLNEEYSPQMFEAYLEGINDPTKTDYIGANIYNNSPFLKGTSGDNVIATASNSDPAIAAAVLALKNINNDAYESWASDKNMIKLEKIRQEMLKKGHTMVDMNKYIAGVQSYDVYRKGKKEVEQKKRFVTPYSAEYISRFHKLEFDLRQARKEEQALESAVHRINEQKYPAEYAKAKEEYIEAKNKFKAIKADWYNFIRYETETKYIDAYYSLFDKMPKEKADELTEIEFELDRLQFAIKHGTEDVIDTSSLEEIYVLETKRKRIMEDFIKQNPQYKEAYDEYYTFYENVIDEERFNKLDKRLKLELSEEAYEVFREFYTIKGFHQDWWNDLQRLYDERESILGSDEILTELYQEKKIILRPHRVRGGLVNSRTLTMEDITNLDEIERKVEARLKELSKDYKILSKFQKDALSRIGRDINALKSYEINPSYEKEFKDRYETLLLNRENYKEKAYEYDNADAKGKKELKKDYEAISKSYLNAEQEFITWYNNMHEDDISFLDDDIDLYERKTPKKFLHISCPTENLYNQYLVVRPNPKYFSYRKLREDRWMHPDGTMYSSKEVSEIKEKGTQEALKNSGEIIELESPYNPNYIESVENIPFPKGIIKDSEGNYMIKPGHENNINIDQRFKDLQNNADMKKVYDATLMLHLDLQKKIDGQKLGFDLPGYTPGHVENIMYSNSITDVFKKQAQIYEDKNLKFTTTSETDEIMNRYGLRPNPQLHHGKTYSVALQSDDAIGAVLAFSAEAYINIETANMAPIMDAYISYLKTQHQELLKKPAAETIEEIDKNGKKIKTVVNWKERAKGLQSVITILEFEQRKFIFGQEEHLYMATKKLLNMFFQYTSFIRIGLDVINQTKNYVSGNVQAYLASRARSHRNGNYNWEDLIFAKRKLYGEFSKNYFADWGNIINLHQSTLIYRLFNPLQKDRAKYIEGITLGKSNRAMQKMTDIQWLGYIWQDKGDTEIGTTVMFAVLNHYKYAVTEIDKDGNRIKKLDENGKPLMVSALDAYTTNADGTLAVRREDVEYTKEDEVHLRNVILHEIRRAQGNYPKSDQTAFEEKAIGKMVFFFRKYVAPQVINRFGYMRPSWEAGDAAYGYYRALAASFKYFGAASALSQFTLGGKLTQKMGLRTMDKLWKKNDKGKYEAVKDVDLGDFWTQRIHHARKDAMMILAFMLLSNMAIARVRQKSDDDEPLSMLEGNAFRILWGVRGETIAMNPFAGGSKEYIRNFTQGFPFLREFNMMHDFTKQLMAYTYVMTASSGNFSEPDDESSLMYEQMWKDGFYQRKYGRYEKGDPKIIKKFWDMTGIKNIRNLIDPTEIVDVMRKFQ